MAAAQAEAEAASKGLALLRCPHTNSGYKNVMHRSRAQDVAAWGPGGFYNAKVNSKILGKFGTPQEAALAVAKKLRWPSGKTCDCRSCKAAAAAPAAAAAAAAPLSEAQVLHIVASEGLTLARSDVDCGFKHIRRLANSYAIRAGMISSLRAESSDFEDPGTFATAAEAALALARILGPEGSADMAKVKEVLTVEEVEQKLQSTADGNAFDGLFGGYECERCFHAAIEGEQDGGVMPLCGMLYRSDGHARIGGRACFHGGFAAMRAANKTGADPVAAKGNRGYDGRCFVWQPTSSEGPSSEGTGIGASSSEGGPGGSSRVAGSYVHHCLWRGCGHTVAGFSHLGWDGSKRDPEMEEVYRHEARAHGGMPMTVAEVEAACYPQMVFGGLSFGPNRSADKEIVLERCDNPAGFKGVSMLPEAGTTETGTTKSACKKRFRCKEVDGAFATAEECALARAKKLRRR